GPRVREHLVPLVERLRDRQRGARREAEARVRLALQAGEVEKQRRQLGTGPGLLAGHAGLVAAALDDAFGAVALPQPLGAAIGLAVGALEAGVEPPTFVSARFGQERCPDFEVVARHEALDAFLALDDDGQRWRLHAADG